MSTPTRRVRPAAAAARSATLREATAKTTSQIIHKKAVLSEQHDTETIRGVEFGPNEHPAEAGVTLGLTISLGDFQFLRIDCQVKIPCRPEDVEAGLDEASDLAFDKLANEEQRWTGSTKYTRG